jgi:hypothetical protein
MYCTAEGDCCARAMECAEIHHDDITKIIEYLKVSIASKQWLDGGLNWFADTG